MVPIKDVFMLDLENKLDASTVKLVWHPLFVDPTNDEQNSNFMLLLCSWKRSLIHEFRSTKEVETILLLYFSLKTWSLWILKTLRLCVSSCTTVPEITCPITAGKSIRCQIRRLCTTFSMNSRKEKVSNDLLINIRRRYLDLVLFHSVCFQLTCASWREKRTNNRPTRCKCPLQTQTFLAFWAALTKQER